MKKLVSALALAALVAGCSEDTTTTTPDTGPWNPTVTPADFAGGGVNNTFYPLPVGAKWVFEADTDEGVEVITVEVLSETKAVAWGVTTTVVRDTVTVDGELAEDTWDWFAQDADGNVWYFGEDTCEYEDDLCVDTGGAWEAGVDGALPGIVMMASPKVGDAYYQEYFEGEAEDYGEVVATDATAEVPAGSFTGCVRTRDTTALDPDVLELKTYCAGVGVVLEEEEDTRVELQEVTGMPTL